MLKLMHIEFYKLRRRWLPWVMLLILLAFIVLMKVGPFSAYLQNRDNPQGAQPPITVTQQSPSGPVVTVTVNPGAPSPGTDYAPGYVSELALPDSMRSVLVALSTFGAVLALIFTAMMLGSEYTWGTLRQTLIKGISRPRFLTAKYLTLAIIIIAGVLTAVVFGFLLSMATTQIVTGGIDWSFMSLGYIGSLLGEMARIALIFAVYVALAALLSVFFRSAATGMALGIGAYFVDTILMQVLTNASTFFRNLSHFSISYNVQQLSAIFANVGATDVRPVWQSAGILGVWAVIFVVLAYFALRRQDLTA